MTGARTGAFYNGSAFCARWRRGGLSRLLAARKEIEFATGGGENSRFKITVVEDLLVGSSSWLVAAMVVLRDRAARRSQSFSFPRQNRVVLKRNSQCFFQLSHFALFFLRRVA